MSMKSSLKLLQQLLSYGCLVVPFCQSCFDVACYIEANTATSTFIPGKPNFLFWSGWVLLNQPLCPVPAPAVRSASGVCNVMRWRSALQPYIRTSRDLLTLRPLTVWMVKTLPRHARVWRDAASQMSGSGERFPPAIPTYERGVVVRKVAFAAARFPGAGLRRANPVQRQHRNRQPV